MFGDAYRCRLPVVQQTHHSSPDNVSVVAFVCKLLEQRSIGLAVLGRRDRPQVKHSSREVTALGQNDSPTLCRVCQGDQALQELYIG